MIQSTYLQKSEEVLKYFFRSLRKSLKYDSLNESLKI